MIAVHQLLPTYADHDAQGMHARRLRRLLRDAGYESDIYAQYRNTDARHDALDPAGLRARVAGRADTWLLYHFAIGSPLLDAALELEVPLALDYHNITDARYFWRWNPPAAATMLAGRRQLAAVAPLARFAVADSGFNARELVALGCRHTEVAPILIDFADYDAPPDAALLARRRQARARGGADWVAVGRLAPNKCQHDVVLAFAAYRRMHDPLARLTLIGGRSAPLYATELHRLAAALGVADAVTFADVATHAELLACYHSADLLLSLSEHEGFNVPVVEAMHFDVPVLAFAAGATPETVGDGGLLLTDKAPIVVATAAERLRSDASLRQRLAAAGRKRVEHFSLARTGPHMLATLTRLMRESGP